MSSSIPSNSLNQNLPSLAHEESASSEGEVDSKKMGSHNVSVNKGQPLTTMNPLESIVTSRGLKEYHVAHNTGQPLSSSSQPENNSSYESLSPKEKELFSTLSGLYSTSKENRSIDNAMEILNKIKTSMSSAKSDITPYNALIAAINGLDVNPGLKVEIYLGNSEQLISLIPPDTALMDGMDIYEVINESICLLGDHLNDKFKGFDSSTHSDEIFNTERTLTTLSSDEGGHKNVVEDLIQKVKMRPETYVIHGRTTNIFEREENGEQKYESFNIKISSRDNSEDFKSSLFLKKKYDKPDGNNDLGNDVSGKENGDKKYKEKEHGINTHTKKLASEIFNNKTESVVNTETKKTENVDESKIAGVPTTGKLESFFINYSRVRAIDQAETILKKARSVLAANPNVPGVAITYSANHDQTERIIDTYENGDWKTDTNGSNQATVMFYVEQLLNGQYSEMKHKFRIAPISTMTTDDKNGYLCTRKETDMGLNYIKDELIGKGWHVLGWQNESCNSENTYAIGGGVARLLKNQGELQYIQKRLTDMRK
ncbi:MAG: hypothetical protein KAG53_02430 [Endozoicomonadaceae bacterium]|nr:hypothetical protein [Endozoicomonadaceae bacterium]